MDTDEIAWILGERVRAIAGSGTVELTGLEYDSRRVTPGSLFVCVKGSHFDGHDFASEAVRAGARALIVERALEVSVPQIVVDDSRATMNLLAAPFYGHPSRHLKIAGVTGTKGKTTTAFLIHSIFEAAGERAGLVGTIEVRFDGRSFPGVRTTPPAVDLQRLLREMVEARVTTCAIEATSIGIHQGRLEGTQLDVAIFTNLSRDHLDEYHGTMQAYYEAKKILFIEGQVDQALVNIDDPWGAQLASEIDLKTFTYGISSRADLVALDVEARGYGSRFRAAGGGLGVEIATNLPGKVNVSNALAAAGAAHLLGFEPDAIARGIEAVHWIPGRFERIEEGQDFTVVVDYAHTPASLREALAAVRSLGPGKVVAVFGCGGDRDRAKRPMMGEAAAAGADVLFLTSDNPRSEDPDAILSEIEMGVASAPPPGGYRVVVDRAEAIDLALRQARSGDVVVIAGKGHETGQEFADRILPFDDREVVREVLRRLE